MNASKRKCISPVIEVGTHVCETIADARKDVCEVRTGIIRLARENGLRVAAAGTHPFSDWRNQEIYPDERYHTIVEDSEDGGAREFDLRLARSHRR